MNTCLNCEKTEQQVPLIQLRFQGADDYICAQCLPLLIHKPEKLSDKLPGMEIVKPVEH